MDRWDGSGRDVLELRQTSLWQPAALALLAAGGFWLFWVYSGDETFAQLPFRNVSWPGFVLIAIGVILLNSRRYFLVFPDEILVIEQRVGPFKSQKVLRAGEHFGFFQDRTQQFETDRFGNTSVTMWHSVFFVRSNGKAIMLVKSTDAGDANRVRKQIEAFLGREIPRKQYGGRKPSGAKLKMVD